MTTYVDAVGAVREWLNSLTATLVGPGRPLSLGVTLKQRPGAATEPYGFMVELPSGLWGGAENPSMSAVLSLQCYGPTRQSACDAAVAYAETLVPLLNGSPVVAGVTVIRGVADIVGPTWLPDGEEPRYIVDATYLFE